MTDNEIPTRYENVLTSTPAWHRETYFQARRPEEGGEHTVRIEALVAKDEDQEWLSLQRNFETKTPSSDNGAGPALSATQEVRYELNIVRETLRPGHEGPRKHYKIIAIIAGDKAQRWYEQLDKQVPSKNGHNDLEDALFMRYV